MQIGEDGFFHLTYCTKVHPGHGWGKLFRNLRTFVPELKEKLAPDKTFGLGLRLSALESLELLQGHNLEQFQEFLDRHHLYVFTLNGFPYGSFHGRRVKSRAFVPDWRQQPRLDYTLRLIRILTRLLPPGMEGSISTLPLSYKPWIAAGDSEALGLITRNLVSATAALVQVQEETGTLIHLDLEPEPDGLVESSLEVGGFFKTWLLPVGAPLLARAAGISVSQASERLREHIQVCLDTCHLAVAFEDPAAALESLAEESIRVGKVQITAGLKVALPSGGAPLTSLAGELAPFARSPYLHQVVARQDGGGRHQFRDLQDALPFLGEEGAGSEWRIHFHMPLFVEGHGLLSSTQADTRAVLRLLKERRFCRHLELETYTWKVLPKGLKEGLMETLLKEYLWVLEELGQG